MDPKFPHVHVQLTNEDGNAFRIMARVQRALTDGGVPAADIASYVSDAMAEDYDHLLQVTMQTVSTS